MGVGGRRQAGAGAGREEFGAARPWVWLARREARAWWLHGNNPLPGLWGPLASLLFSGPCPHS